MHATTTAVSRVESVMAVEAAADRAMNADATEAEAYVTTIAEASTALTLLQAATAPSASRTRVDSVLTAEAAADDAMSLDGTEAEEQVTAAAAPSRVDSVMAAEVLAEDAMNADATELQTHVIATAEASSVLTRCK